MKRKVIFHGEMAERFGKERVLNVTSFGQVVRCFSANFDDFEQYLRDCHDKGITFHCKVNGKSIQSDEEIFLEYPEGDIEIIPIPAGSLGFIKKFFKAVLGAVLMIAGLVIGGPLGLALIFVGNVLFSVGMAELLAPDPLDTKKDAKDADYMYKGTAQTVGERDPVPLCYGEMRIPARAISFEVRNEADTIYSETGMWAWNGYNSGGQSNQSGSAGTSDSGNNAVSGPPPGTVRSTSKK